MTKSSEWKLVRDTWISRHPVLPGVWRRRDGGHAVRARVTDLRTGRMKEIWRVLPEADAATSLKWLEEERARLREGTVSAKPQSERFSEFATSLFEHKVKVGDIRSAAGRNKWAHVLKHLIGGTKGKKAGRTVPGFGDFFMDRLRASDVEQWKEDIAGLIAADDYAPTTANDWLAVLRVIMKAAKRKLGLPEIATDGVTSFDTSEHTTYTEEEPNALLPDEVGPFLARFRQLYPQHFAMVYLGIITGLRPSSLRPLRRRGAEADVDWEHHRIRVRRSHTLGEEVMRTTKQKRRYTIDLPVDAMNVLTWHVETQLRSDEQRDSDLLFPAVNGRLRSTSVLRKPFEEMTTEMKLGKVVTPRALRRTFNDLARAARVDDLVTRSISGHLTEQMQSHYSTVNASEQREGIARVIRLLDRRPPSAARSDGGGAPALGEEGTKETG